MIKEAADQGNEHALTALGIFAQQGINLKRDLNAAAGYFRKASCKGNLYAKQQLISGDFNEFVSEKEYDDLQLELIKRGDRASCHVRAMLQEVKGNTAEAIRLFRKNAAADFTPSAVELYRILSNSKDEKSLKEAADHLFKAISLNNGQAQCMLGASCLQNPETTPRFGVITMMKGLIDGADYPESVLRHLAYLYANGFGVKKSPENARKICESMIEQGYAAGYLTMGEMYQQGVFGKADLKQATEYYQKGAAQGDEACQEALKKLAQNK